jgi:mannose-1-phosphate guanylyltransferase/mannose-6-phosphate isomerase
MRIRPVVLCGGGGARLWPTSTPERPKSFVDFGSDSLLQATLERCRGLDDGPVVVVGALAHRDLLTAQLARKNMPTTLLLEPTPRDTAPAMLAGALRAAGDDPEAIVVLLPSDHQVTDPTAFLDAVRQAAAEAARGRLVVFGVRPDAPSSAYGYIRPAGPGLAAVTAFLEKPDLAVAARLMAEGCLWNGGVLVARIDVLVAEMRRWLPEAVTAVTAALSDDEVLGPAFAEAPRISMDYAVLERTDLARVLPVDFGWSDLGAWDAVAALVPGRDHDVARIDADRVWVRAPTGIKVAVVGLSDLVVVVEDGAILVCSTSAAQEVRRVAEQFDR